MKSKTSIEHELLAMLKKRPHTREELSIQLNLSDRHVRKLVADLRMKGYRILSSSYQAGYWIGIDAEYKIFRNEILGRVRELTLLIKAMDKGVKDEYKDQRN